MIGDFLTRYQDQIGRVIDALARNLEKEPARRVRVVFAIVGIVVIAVGSLAWLTSIERVSGDAFVFLIGSIIGYLFAYLRQITVKPGM